MAATYDAETVIGNGTSTISSTHTPSGTPKGAIVLITQDVGATDEVTGVTYGGSTGRFSS